MGKKIKQTLISALSFCLYIVILSTLAAGEDIECFADGECTQSLFVGQWPATDSQGCLEICREDDRCEFFTFYGDGQDLCSGFVNCVELDDKTCNDCYSGNKSCSDLQCWIPGSCVGNVISINVMSNEGECLNFCKSVEACSWLSFDEYDGACILLETCFDLEVDDCNTCWSSQVQCGERPDFSKVLVIGGYSDGSKEVPIDNVEAIDLSTETPSCDSVANYPFPVTFSVGTMLDGLPTLCGGYNADSELYTNECYQYISDENRWIVAEQSIQESRYKHKASMIDSATWLITGGLNNDGVTMDSSEVWQNGEFLLGPTLPYPLRSHCQVTLNSSYVAIVSGYNGTEWDSYFILLDWKNERWISMPDAPGAIGNEPCGLIENSARGKELVILRSYESCYIFNFEDMTWRDGPNIPYDVYVTSEEMMVQMEKTFYVMGGYINADESVTDAIFMFDNENYLWSMETSRLQMARSAGVAIAVPDEMINCSG